MTSKLCRPGAPASAAKTSAGPIKRRRATKAEVKRRRESPFEIVEAMKPMMIQQAFYQTSLRGFVEKSDAGDAKVQSAEESECTAIRRLVARLGGAA
jgi:hypothetical protein